MSGDGRYVPLVFQAATYRKGPRRYLRQTVRRDVPQSDLALVLTRCGGRDLHTIGSTALREVAAMHPSSMPCPIVHAAAMFIILIARQAA